MKKFLVLIAAGALLGSCSQPLDFTDVSGDNTIQARGLATAAAPVVFYKETVRSYYIYHGISGVERTYDIIVADMAYDKKVNIRFEMADGTWQDFPGTFVEDLKDNQERWQVKTSGSDGWGNVAFSNFGTKFAVNYTVNNTTYWDNNGGQNYTDTGVYLRAGTQVALGALEYYGGFQGKILVRNISPTKAVSVVYSKDNWATTKVAKAYYQGPVAGTDLEIWTFGVYDYPFQVPVSYAISYDVNGTTYWDNNFGSNYLYK